jgi:hypothetical protein
MSAYKLKMLRKYPEESKQFSSGFCAIYKIKKLGHYGG